MMNVKKKNYNDSYLYNLDGNKHNQMLTDFIINAERIENKRGTEFAGIAEDVRRVQRSNVLYTLLLNNDVVLCIGKKEMPRAFKVFMAKDIKEGKNASRKVFIDVTSIITMKNGYYTCKNIQYLITYLFQALCYFVYDRDTIKILDNSTISKSGAEAFSAMFCYIIDYMRIIGYEQSKNKIAYMAALYYLHNMLGKDIDQYVKNIAAGIAEVSPSVANAWDMYYEEKDFMDIDTFVTMISNVFKLKGLNTEVFVGKWTYTYSPSTVYACELFTSFAGVMAAVYIGSYLVNQKQIEKCCGKAMVNFAAEILKIGSSSFGLAESNINWATEYKDKNTMMLKESILGKNKVPDEAKFTKEDFESKSKAEAKAKALVKWYTSNGKSDKISSKLYQAALGAEGLAGLWTEKPNDAKYEIGTVEAIVKVGAKYFNDKNKKSLKSNFNTTLAKLEKSIEKAKAKEDKDKVKRCGQFKLEVSKCISILK